MGLRNNLNSADVLTSSRSYEPVARESEPAFSMEELDIAVVIPCLNEAATIGQVVLNARNALPSARIIVCDNGSTDKTVDLALASGAADARVKPAHDVSLYRHSGKRRNPASYNHANALPRSAAAMDSLRISSRIRRCNCLNRADDSSS
jgi:glycosyltransferase involved in cell wall biosynthesis